MLFGRDSIVAVSIVAVVGTSAPSRAQSSDAVTQLAQTKLAALGYDPGSPDGDLGPETRAAVRAYQRRSGLRATGTLDSATLRKLGVGDSVGRVGPVRDWAKLPTQAQLHRLLLEPIDNPRFPYRDYRPYAPGADLDVPGAAILAAMNASADRFGSRAPGRRGHTDQGYFELKECLLSPFSTTHWSDLTYHYYCQLSRAARTCYSLAQVGLSWPLGMSYSRVDAYRGCANGTLPNAAEFAWVVKTQPIVFRFVTNAQTNAFDHAQEQAVINAFYGIKNPADRMECSAKRPLRGEDPIDGTHCLASKRMQVPLVGQAR
jgi:hypothetical protein